MATKQREPLSRVDAAWLRMDDPTNLMVITSLLIFDTPLNFAQLAEAVEERILRFKRFRQRVDCFGPASESPHWVDDPTFHLKAHLHRVALPSPGDQVALEALVSDLMSTSLDFTKPPWQIHLIENYGSGCALVIRTHHAVGDGVALTHVLLNLTDSPPASALVNFDLPQPKPAEELTRSVKTVLNTALLAGETALREMRLMLNEPYRAIERANQGANIYGAAQKLLQMEPDPSTILKGPLGVTKKAVWSAPIPLPVVKAAGKATGATVNDIMLSAVAGALRRYLLRRGPLPKELEIRAVVPVNLRPLSSASALGNRFGLIFVPLPVGIADAGRRLMEIQARMYQIKESHEAEITYGILNSVGVTPPEVAQRTIALFGSKATAVATNVRGPEEPLRLLGREITQLMFWVPQAGRLGIGISFLSYGGNVVLGLATDAGLVPDPETIAAAFGEEIALLGRRDEPEPVLDDCAEEPSPEVPEASPAPAATRRHRRAAPVPQFDTPDIDQVLDEQHAITNGH